MLPWGDAPIEEEHPAAFTVGDTIYSGGCRGTVVSVGAYTMEIIWDDSDNDSTITYPIDAPYLRRAFPWE